METSARHEIQTPIMVFEQDPQVKRRIRGVTAKRSAERALLKWYLWLQEEDTILKGLTPSELVAYPNRDEVELILEDYINEKLEQGLRYSTLMSYYARIRGFFRDALKPLPTSLSFPNRIKSRVEVEKVENNLSPIFIRRVLDGMRQAPKTAVLCMFQGCMDRARFTYWNETGYTDLMKQLDAGEDVIKISFKGRKKNSNKFYTFIGRDSIEALKDYIKGDRIRDRAKSKDSKEYIFYTTRGTKMGGNQVADVWINAVKRHIEVDPNPSRSTRYGTGLHNLRDVFSTTLNKVDNLKTWVIEFFMGHVVDSNGYNQAMNDVGYMRSQYKIGEPHLNLFSDETTPFDYIKKAKSRELFDSVSILENKNSILQSQIIQLQSQLEHTKTVMLEQVADSLRPKPPKPDPVYDSVIKTLLERVAQLEEAR
jgi:integrase